jgi:hypothetical protein
MKVALCISGQLRHEAVSFPQLAAIARELDATVFVSTWKRRGTKSSGVIFDAQFARMFGEQLGRIIPLVVMRSGFANYFPNFEAEITKSARDVQAEDIAQYFSNVVVDIEDDVMDLGLAAPRGDNNSLRMLYKIWRCNQMKIRHEAKSGCVFDVVVRVRPDVVPGDCLILCVSS